MDVAPYEPGEFEQVMDLRDIQPLLVLASEREWADDGPSLVVLSIPTCDGICVLFLVGIVMLAGCGYSLVRYEGLLDGAQRIAIQTLQNDSDDPGLEMMMTDALRKEFLRRGAFELISDPGAADLVISGLVLPVGTAVP